MKNNNGRNQSKNGRNQSKNGRNQSKNGRNQSKNGRNQSKNGRNQSKNGRNQSKRCKNNYRKKSFKNVKIKGGTNITELLDSELMRVNTNIQLYITISSPDIGTIKDEWSVDPNGSLTQLYNLCEEALEEDLSNYIVTIKLGGDEIAIFEQGKITGENISILEQGIETDCKINIILEKFLSLKGYLNNLSVSLLKNLIRQLSRGNIRTSYKDTQEDLINKFVNLLQKELDVDGVEEMNIFDIINVYKKELEKNTDFYFPKLGIDKNLRNEYDILSREYEEYTRLHDWDPDPLHIETIDNMNYRLREIWNESI